MTLEQQQIAIAKVHGWKWVEGVTVPSLSRMGATACADCWMQPDGSVGNGDFHPPNYPFDLNAMHEAEKVLDTEINLIDDADGFESARDRYMNKLQAITDQRPTHQDDCEWQFLTATAAQRAEAFLASSTSGPTDMSTTMKTIYKYPIQITDRQEIEMPGEVRVLHAGLDPEGTPCVWAMVDSHLDSSPVKLLVVGTGHPMPRVPYRHIGSFVQGMFVWHVFLEV